MLQSRILSDDHFEDDCMVRIAEMIAWSTESGSLRTYARGHDHFRLASCPCSSTIFLSMSACAWAVEAMPFAKASVYETLLVTIAVDLGALGTVSYASSGTGASDRPMLPTGGVVSACRAASADDGTGVIGMNGRMCSGSSRTRGAAGGAGA